MDETQALDVRDAAREGARAYARWLALRSWAAGATAGLAAACTLSGLAIALLAGGVALLHPGRAAVGHNPSADYQVMTWSLEWWPWALRHGVDPLHTPLLWSPDGFSTLWMTTIPTASLLGLPLTLTAGPLVAYNVLALLAVPLAAGAAYLLCRELCSRQLPSLAGALLFGLSPYMLGHTLSQHLDLTLVFPLPLLALLVVRRLRVKTSARRFVLGFAALLLLQLGASLELFVDLTLLVAAGALLVLVVPGPRRGELLAAARLVGLTYAVCLPLLVTIAALMLTQARGPLRFGPESYSTDLLNLVVPTQTLLLGTVQAARAVSRHFVGNIGEQAGYLGLPLLAVAVLSLRAHWRRGAWVAGGVLALALVLSLGPILAAGGRPLAGSPLGLGRLPLLDAVLPARLSLFLALGTAVLCALWLARPGRQALRVGVGALVALSLLPALGSGNRFRDAWSARQAFGWSTPHVSQGFLTQPRWQGLIPDGASVLVLPTGDRTAASYWQAAAGMRFRLAVPATPFPPPPIAGQPLVSGLVNDDLPALEGPQLGGARLRAFLLARGVDRVVVEGTAPRWNRLVAVATGVRPQTAGTAHVYRVRRGLPQLRATGAIARAHSGRFTATAFLRFDGARATVETVVRGNGQPQVARFSSPQADASWTAAAIDRRGQAAFAFSEWREGWVRLRVATHAYGAWHLHTLERSALPLWTPEVGITRRGLVVATWVAQLGSDRVLRSAVRSRDGRWSPPQTLERANGLGGAALGIRGESAVSAWSDTVASQARVRVATLEGSRWTRPRTYATTFDRIGGVDLGLRGTRVRWTTRSSLTARTRLHAAAIRG